MEADIGMMHPQGTPRNASITRGWEQTRFSPKAFRMERGSADNLISDFSRTVKEHTSAV